MNRLSRVFQHKGIFYGLIIIIAVTMSVWICLFEPVRGSFSTTYNDYLIFKHSFTHLLLNKDLYALYPNEHDDHFKYSPTFALFMVPFAILPNVPGVILWNTLNLLLLFYSLRRFAFFSENKKILAMGFILIEALASQYSSQCNCIITGLLILTFECLENKKIGMATLLLLIAVFIKPFALAGFLLFAMYPRKLKAFAFSTAWLIVLLALPLLTISFQGLLGEYKSWYVLLKNDHDVSIGLSVMALFNSWFGSNDKIIPLIIGFLLLFLPLSRYKLFINESFRQIFLASILIWIIIFNHKAESYTYIIAISGVAIWYFTQPFTRLNLILLLLVFIFTIIEPIGLFPWFYHNKYLNPNLTFVIPSLLVWLKITFELMTRKFDLSISNLT